MLPDRPDTGDEQVNGRMGRGQKGGIIVRLSGRVYDISLKIFNTVADYGLNGVQKSVFISENVVWGSK